MTQSSAPRKPATTKRKYTLTLIQAILLGTMIAFLINVVWLAKEGYAKTAARLAARNNAALMTLAARNLPLASVLVGAGVATTLVPAEATDWGRTLLAKAKRNPTVEALTRDTSLSGMGTVVRYCQQGWHLVVLTFESVVIKAASLIASLLLLVMAVILGLLDGFCRRYVRTVEGGRESTYVYHKAVSSAVSLPSFCIILYIVLPLPLSPEIAGILLAVVVFSLVRLSASQFKKYV